MSSTLYYRNEFLNTEKKLRIKKSNTIWFNEKLKWMELDLN